MQAHIGYLYNKLSAHLEMGRTTFSEHFAASGGELQRETKTNTFKLCFKPPVPIITSAQKDEDLIEEL